MRQGAHHHHSETLEAASFVGVVGGMLLLFGAFLVPGAELLGIPAFAVTFSSLLYSAR